MATVTGVSPPGIVVAIACLFFSFGWRPVTAAEVSREARECYQWFATLGFPEVKDATWGSVPTGGYFNPDGPNLFKGYLLKKTANGFRLLRSDLTDSFYKNGSADEPDEQRTRFEPRSFREDAQATLADLHKPDGFHAGDRFGAALGHKAEVFFLSYVCWRKGETELAEALFEEMKKLPGERNRNGEPIERPLRQELEAEIGAMETWDAVLRVGGGRLAIDRSAYAGTTALEPRTALLSQFRRIVRLYPASQFHEYARKTATLLEKMVAEDAAHPKLTPEKIAKLPEEKQIAEWIFRLRDQNGHQDGQPAPFDVFDTRDKEVSPAHRLLAIGYPAVPQLIAALEDKRLSRSVAYHRDFYFSHGILSVGMCAQQILDRIAGQSFYEVADTGSYMSPEDHAAATKKAVRDWWAVEKKGVRQTLADEIAEGTKEPTELLNQLRRQYPDAIEAAVLAGAPKAQKPRIAVLYMSELAKIKTDAATEQLVSRVTRDDDDATVRVAAAAALLNRGHAAALPAIIREWRKLPRPTQALWAGDFKTLVNLLIASGDATTLQELTDHWDEGEDDERALIVERLGDLAGEKTVDNGAMSIEVRPLSPEAKEVAFALLAHATEDSMRCQVMIGLQTGFPSIGDVAVWALHRMEPQNYIFTKAEGSRQREAERIAAANVWRKAHGRELLPLADRPRLAPEQAMRIVNITIEPAAMKMDKEFDAFLDAFVGTDLDEQTLPKILRRFARGVVEGARGIEVRASRANDLTGVRLNVRLQSGRLQPTTGWMRRDDGRIDKTELSGLVGSASDEQMKNDDAWLNFANEIQKALPAPPEVEIDLHASLLNSP